MGLREGANGTLGGCQQMGGGGALRALDGGDFRGDLGASQGCGVRGGVPGGGLTDMSGQR